VVAFSRNDIFAIKREIEQSTPYKCCIIYGALPPSTRADQAKKFNNQNSGYDILVASDGKQERNNRGKNVVPSLTPRTKANIVIFLYF
jgi:hypothetical protein